MAFNEKWKSTIESDIKKYDIMAYIRGTVDAPRCGFTARVAKVLKELGHPFGHADMDQDRDLWDTLSALNDWRTSPQIYIKGEFVGGCDIFCEMYKNGELQKALGLS